MGFQHWSKIWLAKPRIHWSMASLCATSWSCNNWILWSMASPCATSWYSWSCNKWIIVDLVIIGSFVPLVDLLTARLSVPAFLLPLFLYCHYSWHWISFTSCSFTATIWSSCNTALLNMLVTTTDDMWPWIYSEMTCDLEFTMGNDMWPWIMRNIMPQLGWLLIVLYINPVLHK